MDAFGENPVGNGPYMLEAGNHNPNALLVPNPDYPGEHAAQNDGLDIVFYPSQDAAYADLLSGNLDVLDQIPDSAFSVYESDLGDRAVNQPSAVFQRSEEHTSELQSRGHLVCRLLLEKKK